MPKLASLIPAIALHEVGVEEINGTNCGPRVNEYKASTWLPADQAWPWCSAFICWVVKKAMEAAGGPFTFDRPQTAGAWDLINWSLKQDNSTQTKRNPGHDIQAGDIIVYQFSHCGIALGPCNSDGDFPACEGNTDSAGSREGGGVFRKTRNTSRVKARIRFTV